LKNSTTIYVFEVLQKLGIRVPDSMALLGFDDFELASTVRPPISVLQQPVQDIGRAAAELLFEQLLGKEVRPDAKRASARQIVLETRLICRRSCGCAGADSLEEVD
jgi:LacI family transcriptional regulator